MRFRAWAKNIRKGSAVKFGVGDLATAGTAEGTHCGLVAINQGRTREQSSAAAFSSVVEKSVGK